MRRAYFLGSLALCWAVLVGPALATPPESSRSSGIRFDCAQAQRGATEHAVERYFEALGIAPAWYDKSYDGEHRMTFTLRTPASDTDTLTLIQRPEYELKEELIELPTHEGPPRTVKTVSKKEIVLALMQHGRLTEFSGKACTADALKSHVAIRQNTVAWAEQLAWGWPDGGAAYWNPAFWTPESPAPLQGVQVSIHDTFLQQSLYAIGCYTATKLVMAQGILDYYARIAPDVAQVRALEARLMQDNAPLRNVEPGAMWDFEPDYDPQDTGRPGKLLQIQYGVAPRNFVPGDWAYFYNTDPITYQKTGYEGSNAIYIGRGLFDDYYKDHNYRYTYREKMHEVYQWRHGVFSRQRDMAKVQPLTEKDFLVLEQPPEKGGLLLSLRAYPYFFGYQDLPAYPK